MSRKRETKLRLAHDLQMRLHELETKVGQGSASEHDVAAHLAESLPLLVNVCEWCEQHLDRDLAAATMLSKLVGVAGTLLHRWWSAPVQARWRDAAYRAAIRAELVRDELGHGAQLAFLRNAMGDAEGAHQLLDRLIKRNKNAIESLGDGRFGETTIRPSTEIENVHATLLSHRGAAYVAEGKHDQAVQVLREALAWFDSQDQTAAALTLNALAIALRHTGNHQVAVEAFDRAVLHGDAIARATAYINRASSLLALGRRDEAWASIDAGTQLVQDGDFGVQGLAAAQRGAWLISSPVLENRQRGLNFFEQARSLFRAAGDAGNLQGALEAIERTLLAVTQAPGNDLEAIAAAWRRIADVRHEGGDADGALEACRNAIDARPDDQANLAVASIRLGHLLVVLGRHSEAITPLKNAQDALQALKQTGATDQLSPNSEYELLQSLGQAHRHTGNPDAAADCYAQAIEWARSAGRQHDITRAEGNLALVNADRGHFEEAIASLNRIVNYYGDAKEMDPREVMRLQGDVLFNLAYVHHRKGDEEARNRYTDHALRLLTLVSAEADLAKAKTQIASWEVSDA